MVIALLTDFGYQDAYVGVMKGVLQSRCPQATVIDLTHGIPPQAVLVGALHLESAVPYFPAGTLFLAVVDPGVGGPRRGLALRAGDHWFVGPDNGLLWPAASHAGQPEAYDLDRPEAWLPSPGATFHGRDIFAPVAAALASGSPPESLGSPITDPVTLEVPRPQSAPAGVRGEVLMIDHFGNAVTNLRPCDLPPSPAGRLFQVAGRQLRGPASHYGAVPPGQPLVVLGSFGYYEISVNAGSAAAALGLHAGDSVYCH